MSERISTDLERELRGLLQREDPPADFAGRVLAQARGRQPWRPTAFSMLHRRAATLGALALVLAMCASVTIFTVRHQRLEAQNAQRARAQLLTALQVTAGELNWAETQLDQALATPGGGPPRPAPHPFHEEQP